MPKLLNPPEVWLKPLLEPLVKPNSLRHTWVGNTLCRIPVYIMASGDP